MTLDVMYQSGMAGTLSLILGAVIALLLIACVIVSSVLLARAVAPVPWLPAWGGLNAMLSIVPPYTIPDAARTSR